MLYINATPESNVEKDFCQEIFYHLSPSFDNDVVLYVRSWDQVLIYPENKQFITIVTSAEGHNYVPSEQKNLNCLGVFMHYYPKIDAKYQYDSDHFMSVKNVYSLPLGTASPFEGDNSIPISHRPINVAFVGQLDPYRRLDFYKNVAAFSEKIDDSVFHFYHGWNNGIGGEKYSEIMSNTKIALVPCGSASLDTFRYYEAAKCGCVIVCDKQNNYEFMHKAPHIHIDDWSLISILVNSLLSGPTHLNKISNNTYNFWKKRLSPSGAAKFILNKVHEEYAK